MKHRVFIPPMWIHFLHFQFSFHFDGDVIDYIGKISMGWNVKWKKRCLMPIVLVLTPNESKMNEICLWSMTSKFFTLNFLEVTGKSICMHKSFIRLNDDDCVEFFTALETNHVQGKYSIYRLFWWQREKALNAADNRNGMYWHRASLWKFHFEIQAQVLKL